MRCVYIICEKEKKFTSKKNKCNALYIGESKNFEERKKVYTKNHNNELLFKLKMHLFSKRKDYLLEKVVFTEHINFRIIQSTNFKNDKYRKEVEGYLIKRLNPLLNQSKRDGKFERTFKKFEISSLTWNDYKDDCDYEFGNWYWNRDDIGGTEKLFHRKRGWVFRSSFSGRDAEKLNYDLKYKSWYYDNRVYLRFDLWRTDFEKWRKELKFR